MLERLEHDDAGALTHDEAVAIPVVGARGLGGLVVEMGCERAAGREAGHGDAADRALGAAGDHDVGIVQRDQARCIADGMRAGRARGDHGVIGALELMPDGDLARGEIDQTARNEERADPARALLRQQQRSLGDAIEAADARADENAAALLLLRRLGLIAGVAQACSAAAMRVDDEVIDLALLLRLHPIIGIERAVGTVAARNEASDLAGDVRDLELLDAARAALAGKQPRPACFDAARRAA